MNIRKSKGITLISLIVTIVVLLILAGISIATITGGDGTMEKTSQAKLSTEAQAEMEELQKIINESAANGLKHGNFSGSADVTTIKNALKNNGLIKENPDEVIIEGRTEWYVTGNKTNTIYKITNNGEVTKSNDYVKDGLQVYYDGENNTGEGHSNSATTWKDLSGNDNDATLYNIATTPTDDSGWHSNYLAFDGVDDYASKTGITVNGADGTIEIISKYISGTWIFRSNASGSRTYIQGLAVAKGNPAVYCNFINDGTLINIASRILKYYTKNETSYFVPYFNMNPRIELNYTDIRDGSYIVFGSSEYNNAKNPAKMNVYAVRIYNRALTETEIRNNYEIDKARFNIEE